MGGILSKGLFSGGNPTGNATAQGASAAQESKARVESMASSTFSPAMSAKQQLAGMAGAAQVFQARAPEFADPQQNFMASLAKLGVQPSPFSQGQNSLALASRAAGRQAPPIQLKGADANLKMSQEGW